MLIKLTLVNGKFVATTRDYQAEGRNPEEALRSLGAALAADIDEIFPPEDDAKARALEEFAAEHPGQEVAVWRHACGHDAPVAYWLIDGMRFTFSLAETTKCVACGGHPVGGIPWVEPDETGEERLRQMRRLEMSLMADLASRGIVAVAPSGDKEQ
jgi:hypothetical protein